jgi:CheY-like chemotaxis protein
MTELGEIFSMLQDKAKAKSLALDLIFDGEMPKTILSCPLRLRQILHNVVGNALKFTDKGGVVIVVKLVANSQGIPPVLLRFMITDTGCGLDLKQQQRLFQPFSQGDNSLTRKFGGTGLGLVLARRLAQALGGDFVLSDSKPGKGSTFTFTIDPGPLVGVPMLQRQTKDDLIVRKETPRELFAANLKLEEIRILLVEDGPDNQILMTHILEASGAILSSALNGAEALQMALSNEYDVILMDMQMPIMDGYEATRQLRAKGYTKPIIALTANAMRGEREICLAAGCVEYISKPFKANQLVATVAKFVSQPS